MKTAFCSSCFEFVQQEKEVAHLFGQLPLFPTLKYTHALLLRPYLPTACCSCRACAGLIDFVHVVNTIVYQECLFVSIIIEYALPLWIIWYNLRYLMSNQWVYDLMILGQRVSGLWPSRMCRRQSRTSGRPPRSSMHGAKWSGSCRNACRARYGHML